jgi:hypothetical protein
MNEFWLIELWGVAGFGKVSGVGCQVSDINRGRWLKGSQFDQRKKLQSFTTEIAENAEKENFKIISVISVISVVK